MYEHSDGSLRDVGDVYEDILRLDPAGRFGAPRSLELRQFQELPEAVQRELTALLDEQLFTKAALIWKRHCAGTTADALATVQRLRRELPRTQSLSPSARRSAPGKPSE
ncbi:MAG: hypothetical protein QM756_17440 [Polyangiaceae bacterium]